MNFKLHSIHKMSKFIFKCTLNTGDETKQEGKVLMSKVKTSEKDPVVISYLLITRDCHNLVSVKNTILKKRHSC